MKINKILIVSAIVLMTFLDNNLLIGLGIYEVSNRVDGYISVQD